MGIKKQHLILIKAILKMKENLKCLKENKFLGFPGGAVVKNPPANAGDMGLSPGSGTSHMPWSN